MVPGILAMLGYVVVVGLVCRFRPQLAMPSKRVPWPERIKALIQIWPVVLIFIVVFGGIYQGIFSPTESTATQREAIGRNLQKFLNLVEAQEQLHPGLPLDSRVMGPLGWLMRRAEDDAGVPA
jgi:TRAP-type mannitol/chloroaromatic compound transport system permease large subunit